MDDDEAAMDLDLLLTGPKNEQNLDECLGVGGIIYLTDVLSLYYLI